VRTARRSCFLIAATPPPLARHVDRPRPGRRGVERQELRFSMSHVLQGGTAAARQLGDERASTPVPGAHERDVAHLARSPSDG